ncbi:hypothetical protein ACFWBG_17965 [Nocardia salmonicida]|uniref:hypothetical protein n=1 Tax=Nocardia salmonicida TaxID=53431 RepID=UPI00366BD061
MDAITDAQFTRLLTELRPLRVSGYSSSEIEDEWDRLGWQRGDSISALIPGTDFRGRIEPAPGPMRSTWTTQFTVPLGESGPEQFRHLHDLMIATWGPPSWYCGLSNVEVAWVDGETLRKFDLSVHGTLDLTVCAAEGDNHRRMHWYENPHEYLESIGEEDMDLTDENDLAYSVADDYEFSHLWSAGGSPGYQKWRIETPKQLRGVLTELLVGVHMAMRAVGRGTDDLRLEFSNNLLPVRPVLELDGEEIRLWVSRSEPAADHSTAHGSVDSAQGLAPRRWPATPEQARVAATATVIALHDLGIADDMLHIRVSGEPLAAEGFSMDMYLEFVDRYAQD